jgi:hypothetical protein
MSTEHALPLYSFEPGSLPAIRTVDDYDSDDERPGNPRRWYHYVPLCGEYYSHSGKASLTSFSYSRGPAPSCATSFHLTRPSQLSLSDPPHDALLPCPPARHIFPFLPRVQLSHRLRGA